MKHEILCAHVLTFVIFKILKATSEGGDKK